jgi:HlyD family secretion protein
MKKTILISIIAVVVVIAAIIVYSKVTSKKDVANLYAEVSKGQFDIVVTTTGELQAENSTDIRGPEFSQSRNIRVMDIKIQDLVAEGTEVKKGDYVATLDRTSFDNTLKDEIDRLTTYDQNLEVKMLDTAVTLSNLRDNIKNLRFSVEEAQITLQQSKYEPPTTIRQAEISLDKANRSLDQAIRGYALRVEQTKSDVRNLQRQISEQRQRVADLQKILSNFIITAPSDGMVIYKRDRTGTKRKIGSSISPFDPVVATLPDLSTMISKTYVNEIDVSKVKSGQKVEIMVDAFPEKSYSGVVTSVANIGEQLPNTDSKVFEVLVKVNGSDPILKPSMTTGNKIITNTINDVLYVPLECVQAGDDSIPFVYSKKGYRQVVLLGESNENNVIVEKGLEEGEIVYLSTPEKPETFKMRGEELIPEIKERERIRKEEEMRIRREAEEAAKKRSMMGGFGGGGQMMFQGGAGGGQRGNRQFQGEGNMQGPGAGQGAVQVQGQAAQGANQVQGQGGQMQQGQGQGQGRVRDTAAFRRMMQDTAARRRFMQMRQQQQGGATDTTRRNNSQQTPGIN